MELTIQQALERGIAAHKEGNLEEADRLYTAILKSQPQHPDANHNMGILAVSVGKLSDALPFFKIALEGSPAVEQYWLSYLDILVKLGRISEARSLIKQGKNNGLQSEQFKQLEVRLDATAPTSILKDVNPSKEEIDQLVMLYQSGNFEETLEQGEALANKFPKSSNIFNILGVAHTGLEQYEYAAKSYTKAIELRPDYAIAHSNLGNILDKLGQRDKAIDSYSKAIELQPDYLAPRSNLGNLLSEIGRYDEAIIHLNKAIELQPDYAEPHNNLANLLTKLDRHEEAVDHYIKAIKLQPLYATTHYNLANTFKEMERNKEAIDCYNKALEINPKYVDAYNNLGIIFNETGQYHKAIAVYRKALTLNPFWDKLYVNLATTYSVLEQFNEAIKVLDESLMLVSNSKMLNFAKGRLLVKLGNLNEGLLLELAGGVFSFDSETGITLRTGLSDEEIKSI